MTYFCHRLDLLSFLLIIMVCVIFLDYSSKKSNRTERSIIGSELYASYDYFDIGMAIRKDLEFILGNFLSLHMFTDSLQLIDEITKGQK